NSPKQFQLVQGIPVVLRAVQPFVDHPEVTQVVVVLPPADAASPPGFLSTLTRTSFAAGGAHRGDSVRAGLAALAEEPSIVLVHDGASPFVSRGVIDGVISYARPGEGAVAAAPLNDT